VKAARISGMAAYKALCSEAEKDFTGFWSRHAKENRGWAKPFTQVPDESFSLACVSRLMAVFGGTVTNVLLGYTRSWPTTHPLRTIPECAGGETGVSYELGALGRNRPGAQFAIHREKETV